MEYRVHTTIQTVVDTMNYRVCNKCWKIIDVNLGIEDRAKRYKAFGGSGLYFSVTEYEEGEAYHEHYCPECMMEVVREWTKADHSFSRDLETSIGHVPPEFIAELEEKKRKAEQKKADDDKRRNEEFQRRVEEIVRDEEEMLKRF